MPSTFMEDCISFCYNRVMPIGIEKMEPCNTLEIYFQKIHQIIFPALHQISR